jgi:hypothetical protein
MDQVRSAQKPTRVQTPAPKHITLTGPQIWTLVEMVDERLGWKRRELKNAREQLRELRLEITKLKDARNRLREPYRTPRLGLVTTSVQ